MHDPSAAAIRTPELGHRPAGPTLRLRARFIGTVGTTTVKPSVVVCASSECCQKTVGRHDSSSCSNRQRGVPNDACTSHRKRTQMPRTVLPLRPARLPSLGGRSSEEDAHDARADKGRQRSRARRRGQATMAHEQPMAPGASQLARSGDTLSEGDGLPAYTADELDILDTEPDQAMATIRDPEVDRLVARTPGPIRSVTGASWRLRHPCQGSRLAAPRRSSLQPTAGRSESAREW